MRGVLRAVGDARRAMYVTLAGGLATAVIDPLLIFWAGLGADGAAWAIVLSRVVFCVVGYHGAVRVHRLVARPSLPSTLEDLPPDHDGGRRRRCSPTSRRPSPTAS